MQVLFQPYDSVSGKRWYLFQPDASRVTDLSNHWSIPESVSQILLSRGLDQQVQDILDPTLRRLMPDPLHFLGMHQAVTRMHKALLNHEKIVVLGDYDVDGGCSTALLIRYLRQLQADIGFYIPDRLREGYGPNKTAMDCIHQQGAKLVVTVDCGTTANEVLSYAQTLGLDVVVLDHHLTNESLPPACAVVNPNRFDETTPYRYLAAVGVAFLFLVALQRELRESGFFKERLEPNLMHDLDLVALATVCDVVPLVGLNRAFVRSGLKVLSGTQNLGLKTLLEVAHVNETPHTYHLGYVLGPRINAGGRVGESDLGVRLLTTTDSAEATALALRLDAFNRERQAIEQTILDAAIAQVLRDQLDDNPMIMVKDQGWHPGVIGIVASRLTERFSRPSVVIAVDQNMGKASGRSIKGIDLGAAILAAREQGLLVQGGGHAMAGGFTMDMSQFESLQDFFYSTIVSKHGRQRSEARLMLDANLSLHALDLDLWQHLSQLAPFGAEHPEPKFVVDHCQVAYADIVGEKHVRATLRNAWGKTLSAIAFRAVDTPIGQALLGRHNGSFHVAGVIRKNVWQGRENIQFQILDVMVAHELPDND